MKAKETFKQNISVVFVALIFTAGCAYTNRTAAMNSWMGAHISTVIQSWGPPTQITSDGAGGRIYIWRPTPMVLPPLSPYATANEQNQYAWRQITVQIHNSSYKMFYARANGIIYYWRVS